MMEPDILSEAKPLNSLWYQAAGIITNIASSSCCAD